MTPQPRWRLEHAGRRLEVETESVGWSTMARLFVDGEKADEAKAGGERAELEAGGVTVRLRLTWLGRIRECLALLPAGEGGDEGGGRRKELAFEAPSGSRAARLQELAKERPGLYASRHVALAVGRILAGVLGLGALIGLLLPRLPLPSIDPPDVSVNLPSLPLPSIDPPDITLPGWVEAILGTTQYWVPVLIAIAIARREAGKRRERQRNAEEQARGASADAES